MIIISEGFSSYMNIKYHSSAYVIIYPMMLRGKKKTKIKHKKTQILVFTLSYGMFQSHLFYG